MFASSTSKGLAWQNKVSKQTNLIIKKYFIIEKAIYSFLDFGQERLIPQTKLTPCAQID
jgi:hypothetical protein